jgi:hypothetical protein
MSKYIIFIFSINLLFSCNSEIKEDKDSLFKLSEDSINLKLQKYIVSNIDSLINFKNGDCENDLSDIPTSKDFRYSNCFTIEQGKDNEFIRFRLEDGISQANFDLIHWTPYWDDDDFNKLFHSIDYWILDNTIVKGDINNDNIEDYAIKVLKKPSGYAQALWITDWYFLISSDSSYIITKFNLFNGTYREPNYDISQIKTDTIIGHYQYYDTHLLPFDSKSIIDTTNLLVYKYSNNEISFIKQDFYIIPFMTMSNEQKAKEIQLYLTGNNFTAGYLWLPDFSSLSDNKQYVAFVGPFSTEKMCKSRLLELKKDDMFKDSYGILVSKNNERKEIRIK